jgi:hypothetical protein
MKRARPPRSQERPVRAERSEPRSGALDGDRWPRATNLSPGGLDIEASDRASRTRQARRPLSRAPQPRGHPTHRAQHVDTRPSI